MLTIYKASAGSGKTYNLAFEYIKLLLGRKDPDTGCYRLRTDADDRMADGIAVTSAGHRGILAVTFTNKATEEMKTRIIQELDKLTRMPQPGVKEKSYAPRMMQVLRCSRQQLAQSARKALDRLLNDYGNFRVSTIDSFFQSVLRTFAREVDRRGDYEVEMNDAYAYESGVGMMLDDINYGDTTDSTHRRMTRWVRDYADAKVDAQSHFNVFNRRSGALASVLDYMHGLTDEKFRPHLDALIKYLDGDPAMERFRKALRNRIGALAAEVQSLAQSALKHCDSVGCERQWLNNKLRELLEALADGTPVDYAKRINTKYYTNAIKCDDINGFYTLTKLPRRKGEYVMPDSSVPAVISDTLRHIEQRVMRGLVYEDFYRDCSGLEFMNFVRKYIDEFRRDNNLILISDTNALIHSIINGAEMPFIYERMGVELTNFLIDEFQDTSHLQWANLRPLVANSISNSCDSMIIGDEKQSIYRWRNSDSDLLHHLVAKRDFPTSHHFRGKGVGENDNHRSSHTVVRFNNTVFARIGEMRGIDTYADVAQTLPDDTAEITGRVVVYDTSQLDTKARNDAALELTAHTIIKQHERGYRWSEIAVLVRTATEGERLINYITREYPEIEFSSAESLYLQASTAVRQVISIMKLVNASYEQRDLKPSHEDGRPRYGNMTDTIMMLSRFEYHLGRLKSEMSNESDGNSRNIYAEALEAALGCNESLTDRIHDEVAWLRNSNPTNIVALAELIIDRHIPPEQQLAEGAYIAALVDCITDYCARFNPSLSAFLDYWDEVGDRRTISPGATRDAVSIMTIHKAKGLEWPCVHVPFANWRSKQQRMWFDLSEINDIDPADRPPMIYSTTSKQMERCGGTLQQQAIAESKALDLDNLNLAYVAFTRARQELNVVTDTSVSNSSQSAENGADSLGRMLRLVIGFDGVKPSAARYDNPNLGIDIESVGCSGAARDNEVLELSQDKKLQTIVIGDTTVPYRENTGESKVRAIATPYYRVTHHADTGGITAVEDATSLRAVTTTSLPESEPIGNEVEAMPVTDNDNVREERSMRGMWLHGVLARINRLDDFDRAFENAVSASALDEKTAQQYRRVLTRAFESLGDERDRWFVRHSMALSERSVYLAATNTTWRPDRVVIGPDGSVEVVDYKFTSTELPGHQDQMRNYMKLMLSMGYESVRGFVWYPEDRRVVEVKL